MVQLDDRNRDRIKSAIGVAAFHAVLLYALLVGLGYNPPEIAAERLNVFDVLPEKPPPPLAEPPRAVEKNSKPKTRNPEGAASPKNLKDTPSPIVALPPIIPLEVPSPIVAPPIAAEGNRASAGASDVPGPGTGSGGQGTGRGSGSAGDGTGGGGGGGGRVRGRGGWLRLLRGSIYDSDWPGEQGEVPSGIVHLRFVVAPTGRVRECNVTRSSGRAELDETTCRLIKRRFRYRPERNEQGRAIASVVIGLHDWERVDEPEPIDVEPTIPD